MFHQRERYRQQIDDVLVGGTTSTPTEIHTF